LTGILDRLERGGWIERGRNTAMDQICAAYDDNDLQLLAGFLRQTADAARTAAEKLTTD
jgi:DNA-binding MarR family transcriptional regulator